MTSQPRLRRELVRFFKFIVVGSIGAVIDFGIFNLLNGVLGVWYLLAATFSFISAVSSNFLWNRYWTYPDSRSKKIHAQAVQFTLVNLVGLAIRTPILALTERPMTSVAARVLETGNIPAISEILARLSPTPTVLGRNLALALAVVVVLLWNFGVNRIWTYSDAP